MRNKHIGLRLGVAFAVLIAILVGIVRLGLRPMKSIKPLATSLAGNPTN